MKAVSVVVLSILAIGLLAFFGWMGLNAYRASQGPALDSTTEPLFTTHTPQVEKRSATAIPPAAIKPVTATSEGNQGLATEVIASAPEKTLTPVELSAESCGESGAWNVLILGSDYADMNGQKGSDLTRILRADFANNRVIIFSFSRDLWVETAGIGLTNPNIDETRLGRVFYEGRIRSLHFAAADTLVDGTRATAKMLDKNFTLKTDHYLTLDLQYLATFVDAVGGLSVNVPARITDPLIGMTLEAGQQTLSGSQVVTFVRAVPDSDFDRIKRNDLFLQAIREKLLDPAIIAKIPDLYAQFKVSMASDLSLEQVNHLVCLLKNIPESSITQDSVKKEWTSSGPQGSLSWDKAIILGRLKELTLIP